VLVALTKKPLFRRLTATAERVSGWVAKAIATALGAGLSPVAPGTCGTLVALPLAYWLAVRGRAFLILGALAAAGIGIWAADVCVELWHKEDDQRIVIDEVAGYLTTMLLCDARSPVNLVLGFGLFRLLDSWKPGPIRTLDDRVGGGLGVVLDDLAAGVVGAVVLMVFERAGVTGFIQSWIGSRFGG
jgi:phosphatidylglycerophosphatase A